MLNISRKNYLKNLFLFRAFLTRPFFFRNSDQRRSDQNRDLALIRINFSQESHNSASTTQNHANRPQKKGQKLLNLVDKIAHSKYFREASELRPIRKMMEDISSTRLMLNVEITTLEGTMTCNFPPPPSDRLW